MRPQQIIEKKRSGSSLSDDEIESFVRGATDGSWAEYQLSAMLMAMFLCGLTLSESLALTRAMLCSGDVLDFSDIDRPKADKHSTGGVGDKTSIIVAPLAAACGLVVPMISGRGLAHTGGTLDKLESIKGYTVDLSPSQFRETIQRCGFAMAGQTDRIAPADKKLYGLRDATATVPYVPFIVASIMSKKLAEGLDALVLDVKTGSGAFMRGAQEARELAARLVDIGRQFGVKVQAVVSDMNQPLGRWVGNAVEISECIDIMRGNSDAFTEVTRRLSLELVARMLLLSGLSENLDAAAEAAERQLASGAALEAFRANVALQGGDPLICDGDVFGETKRLEKFPILSPRQGFVGAIDTIAVGNAVAEIGGGRVQPADTIDHLVAFELNTKIGDAVAPGDALGFFYCRSTQEFESTRVASSLIFEIVDECPSQLPPLIVEVVE